MMILAGILPLYLPKKQALKINLDNFFYFGLFSIFALQFSVEKSLFILDNLQLWG
jgi:hypothetical protein